MGEIEMTPIKKGRYEFRKESLIEIRKKIGISQGKMAELLEVPANTLSRWEIGATVPDAKSLASVYSVAKEHGITPTFFSIGKETSQAKPFRYNLVVIWDFQTTGVPAYVVKQTNSNIEVELNKRFSGMTPLFKAFTHPTQEQAAKELENLGWRVWEGDKEVHEDIIEQAKSDSGQNPDNTVLVLISQDNGFVDLIDQLTDRGVQVYVMSPQSYSNQLFVKVGPRFSIQWFPMFSDLPRR
jgi:transcriptional regulator with XRE-family HTH domain